MKAFTEFVGTFIFLFVISLVANFAEPGSVVVPFAIGGALAPMVYMGGHWSGGQYNPAVSFGLLLQRKLEAKQFAMNVIAQLAGGVLAFWVGFFMTGKSVQIHPDYPTKALLVEMIFTMALVLVVMNVAVSKKTQGNSFYGLAIGLVIFIGVAAGGPISGGAFNPAVGIGSTTIWALCDHGSWSNVWIPVVGPLLGGAVGSFIWSAQEGIVD